MYFFLVLIFRFIQVINISESKNLTSSEKIRLWLKVEPKNLDL